MIGYTLYVDKYRNVFFNIDKYINVPLDFLFLPPNGVIYGVIYLATQGCREQLKEMSVKDLWQLAEQLPHDSMRPFVSNRPGSVKLVSSDVLWGHYTFSTGKLVKYK